ncbi:MAG: adenylyl-sulfate kinase [Caldilinea sp. CFX5]|nr:adenylyl-sulfate kinase [Caldilinea sp. CFX5]
MMTNDAFALWFTGLPAAGKTTLARAVQRQLADSGVQTFLLDSDELRTILTPQPTYAAEERDWFYGALADLAAWLVRNGINVLIAATANRRAYRQRARHQIARFGEVYVHCALATCQQRDPKGIYARAATGAAHHVPGFDATFEAPLQPEATVDTDQNTPEESAAAVLRQLDKFLGLSLRPSLTIGVD